MRLGAIIVDNRKEGMKEIINRHAEFLDDKWEIIWMPQHKIESARDYNLIMTSYQFWSRLPFDKVLIFQHDSGLLRKGIEEFLEYDFIGAPIQHIDFPAMNGGLSLRDVSAMLNVIVKTRYNPNKHGNEDMYFCNQLAKNGGKLPTKDVAQKFSVETIYNTGSLGYHAMNKYLTKEECETILNQYK